MTTFLNDNKRTLLLFVATTLALAGFVMFASAERVGAAPETCGTGTSASVFENTQARCENGVIVCNSSNGSPGVGRPNDGLTGTNENPVQCWAPDGSESSSPPPPGGGTTTTGNSTGSSDFRSTILAGTGTAEDINCKIRVGLSAGEINSLGLSGVPGLVAGQSGTVSSNAAQAACTYSLIKQIINWFTLGIGLAALVLILFAGFLWITAQDSDEKTKKAKTTAVAAIAGFSVALLAQVILRILQSTL